MGMAASQARFLGLTARKTNVEYQGQQVNQARTVLANESAGLFNSMMVLKVPTPPVVNDYYTSRYKFSGATLDEFTLDTINPTTNPEYVGKNPPYYDVTMTYLQNKLSGGKSATEKPTVTVTGDGTPEKPYVYKYGDTVLNDTTDEDKANIEAIIKDLKYPEGQKFLTYTRGSEKYYIEKMDPAEAGTSYEANLNYTANKKVTATAKGVAQLVKNDKDRYTSINFATIEPEDAKAYVSTGSEYALDISKTYDELAYQEANKNYEFQKTKYEQELQVINAKTEKLQMEDRTLELKLRQLDTEQKALQTEMESVQKVIQKNVEVTFKTFA